MNPEIDKTREGTVPLTDDEMRKAIDKQFNEDAIYDAAVDVTLAALGRRYWQDLFPSPYGDQPNSDPELEAFRKAFRDNLEQHGITTGLSNKNTFGSQRDGLRDRFENRQNNLLFRTALDVPTYHDEVLDAAKEILKLDDPYVQWPEVPGISHTIPSLQQMAEVEALRGLQKGLAAEKLSSLYSCSGEIPISEDLEINNFRKTDTCSFSAPVLVRWDSTPTVSRRLKFPVATELDEEAFQQLLHDCQPATFGRGGEDVYDESYRRAGKLDASQFSTSFDIHESGILNEVARWLLPGISGPTNSCSISAELYKLNVYSGPLGRFRSHVDTPRGDSQFASLVICLPSPHSGGALAVRHDGTELIYDWSTSNSTNGNTKIEWAAFYSDCEHEVRPVHSGHRITLAYNLYIADRVGWTLKQPNVHFNPSLSIPYKMLRDLLLDPAFMKSGGVLGIPCSHKYAQTSGTPQDSFPTALKGIDLSVYEAIRALKLPVKVAPIISSGGSYGGISFTELLGGGGLEVDQHARAMLHKFQREGNPNSDLILEYEDEEKPWNSWRNHHCRSEGTHNIATDFESRLEQLKALRRGKVKGLTVRHRQGRDVIIGTNFKKLAIVDRGGEDEGPDEVLDEEFPHVSLPSLIWLCEKNDESSFVAMPGLDSFEETQLAHLAYGNEASMHCWYVSVVIIVVIPKSSDRPLPPSMEKIATET